jgi:BCD family chlorophyll transporter-like MFS transporter
MGRFLVAVGLGTAAFAMQDIILEPYGGEVLKLPVGATSLLSALTAGGALAAFALAARQLARGADPLRLAAYGAVAGLAAFSAVIFAEPLDAAWLFRTGAALIGFGGGLFAVGTLSAAMGFDAGGLHGMVLGAWGAVQATCTGAAVAAGGVLRDLIATLAASGALGDVMNHAGASYGVVYHLELGLLFATLVAIGPLVRRRANPPGAAQTGRFGLADLPG